MPVPLRSNRAEIKYNVTTDFPHLGLHSAAATGNVGLVKYALSHGQPINSVLDGVLPLHAACSGGNDLVVRLLIDHGADVNAPRLPRRYSNDKHRDASAPIVGTSGSTPLHFAAANGHTAIVSTLLLHGAHAHRSDKHGVTPEMLARQNGWPECADLLRAWLLNKDKDLREREILPPSSSSDVAETSSRKRLQVKRSLDNAFNKIKPETHLKVPITTSPSSSIRSRVDSPSPTSRPWTEDLSCPITDAVSEIFQRLPSLSHSPPPRSSISESLSSSQRPRSAGTGAESPQHQSNHTRKLGTKYSLLHLFKRSQTTGEALTSSAGAAVALDRPYLNDSSLASSSSSTLPIPIPLSKTLPASTNEPPLSPLSISDDSSRSYPSRSAGDGDSNVPQTNAINVHRAVDQHHTRVRSSSGVGGNGGGDGDDLRLFGLMRSHNRSSSQGQSHSHFGSRSILRFDSVSSLNLRSGVTHLRQDSNTSMNPASPLKSSYSFHSLQRVGPEKTALKISSPRTMLVEDTRVDGDEDDEEYGIPLEHSRFATDDVIKPIPRLGEFQGKMQQGGQSLSSSSSSLSQGTVGDAFASLPESEFPSGVHRPSPLELEGQLLAVPLPTAGPDNRARGDSVSSMSTDGSNNPQLSSSGTTATSKSSITAPGVAEVYLTFPDKTPSSPPWKPHDLTPPELGVVADDYVVSPHRLSLGQRRSHTPLDINIRSISSHAQAEALVQRAQQSIFEMANQLTLSDEPPHSAGLSSGRSPLSAKLAAYGESLAIERKLKKEEDAKREKAGIDDGDRVPPSAEALQGRTDAADLGLIGYHEGDLSRRSITGRIRRTGLDRQFSLEHKSSVGSRSKVRIPKRPNTSGGTSTESCPCTPSTPDCPQSAAGGSAVDSKIGSPLKANFSSPAELDQDLDDGYRLPASVDDAAVCQTATPPAPEAFGDSVTKRAKGDQARHIASANKLTRMGFASPDGRQTTTAPSGSPRSHMGNKPMFGGLKTLMQSLKGRS